MDGALPTCEMGVKSATVGYAPPGYPPFPGAICTSVNHQVCHGIPGDKVLKNGDSLNIDVTIIKDGWFGDTSRMYHVGEPSILSRRLTEITYDCMWKGIEQVRNVATLGEYAFVFGRGGVPVIEGDQVVGAVGVSGAVPADNDHLIADAAAGHPVVPRTH